MISIRPSARPPAPTGVSWQVFSSAPHRMMFLAGAIQTVAVMVFWLFALLERYTGVSSLMSGLALPAIYAHVFLMIYGLFPFFIFGFLFTVYPRWMATAVIPRRHYVPAFAFLTAGIVLFYWGLWFKPALLVGIGLFLLGWLIALFALLAVYRQARPGPRPHEVALNLTLLAGAIGVACFVYAAVNNSTPAFAASQTIGLWLFLTPTLFTVSHRMIPFFSESALRDYRGVRPAWTLPAMVAGLWLHGVLMLFGATRWLPLADIPLFALVLYHLWIWQFWRSFAVPLLAMHYVALAWFAIALLLDIVQEANWIIGGELVLGRAPLHALGIGFIGTMLLGMASRVTLGHSGHPLAADRLTIAVFGVLNLAAILRVVSELQIVEGDIGYVLIVLAGLAWLGAFVPWVWRYAPWYLRPRADGKPG